MKQLNRLSLILLSIPACAGAQEHITVVDSLPEHLLYLYTTAPTKGEKNSLDQMVAGGRKWEAGRTLRVCLFQGNKAVASLIRKVASEWNAYSSTKFDFGPSDSWYNCLAPNNGYFQIRVGFSSQGYWSAVGTHAESLIDNMAPTMNLERFNRQYSESKYSSSTVTEQALPFHKAVIRHEFGHALGLLHEASNPKLNCQAEIRWKGDNNAYDYYAQPPNSWGTEQVNRNLGFVGQTDPDYLAGEEDIKSVMFYSLPPDILIDGTASKCYTTQNLVISEKDAKIIAKIYPLVAPLSSKADIDLKTANLKALPLNVSNIAFEDIQTRILADIESNDPYVRRDARVRLNELLAKDNSFSQTATFLQKVPQGTYRYQLGVAVALANSSKPVEVDPALKAVLVAQQKETKDNTLKLQLKNAIDKLVEK